ncbi:ATP-binding cassette domain-containing protein [Aestuariibaculum suncheonense]|uniref:ATP-binding cassette domain-containing protein n=1 Tax=Aestuariibaculum suncheonense TaxID=1028745 RepID=A0A8J6UGT8_9FLAO|nr:ATP-binding cassette domain-containing protein [Aestuariibaculum suncheonense]MBD0835364.1 ATP-binding cassette domain-containing protein [Aestuariibaculum suncheonense]
MNTHIAIYISNKDRKQDLIDRIQNGTIVSGFSKSKSALFSEITINKLIQEERIHGTCPVVTPTGNALGNSSQGERKRALLNHIISQNTESIIVDNVFGNLDIEAQAEIARKLDKVSNQVRILQITKRKEDILPFIEQIYHFEGDKFVEFNTEYKAENNQEIFVEELPKAYRPVSEEINPIVKFTKVSVNYRARHILDKIDWEIKKGEFWQLMGPNGSGKSTILSMIFGDNPKAFGQDIVLFGVKKGSGESVWEIKQKIGYFSSDMLRGFTRLDSIGNMIVSGFFDTIGLYKTPTNEQIKIAQHWLRVLDMFDIRKQDFLSLSKGYQSLVLIARAMVKHPPLLILDEPTNGLDDADVRLFTQLINKIASETETAILYVSHRKEAGLTPDFIYQLTPCETGSTGGVVD